MLWALCIDLISSGLSNGGLVGAAWILFAIYCVVSYRYLYLGYHYALSPIRLGLALSEAPRLLNYNRWSVLIACTTVSLVIFFVISATGDILNKTTSSPLLAILTFLSYLFAYLGLLWLYTITFLGYAEARDNCVF
jgi:hypothetical protein